MHIPGMYIVGLASNIIFLILTMTVYYYISGKTGARYNFLLYFSAAWLVSALSYIFLITGVSSDEWYITVCRIITYIFFLLTIISIFVELAKLKNQK